MRRALPNVAAPALPPALERSALARVEHPREITNPHRVFPASHARSPRGALARLSPSVSAPPPFAVSNRSCEAAIMPRGLCKEFLMESETLYANKPAGRSYATDAAEAPSEECFTSEINGDLISMEETTSSTLELLQSLQDRLFGAQPSPVTGSAGNAATAPPAHSFSDNYRRRARNVRSNMNRIEVLARQLSARI